MVSGQSQYEIFASGGGGGATDLRVDSEEIGNRVIVAAGGSGGVGLLNGANGGELTGKYFGVVDNILEEKDSSLTDQNNGPETVGEDGTMFESLYPCPSSGGGGGYRCGASISNAQKLEQLVSHSGSSYISGYPGCALHQKLSFTDAKMKSGVKGGNGLLIINALYECRNNCSDCKDSYNCTDCQEGFYLFNYSCISQCPKGMSTAGRKCIFTTPHFTKSLEFSGSSRFSKSFEFTKSYEFSSISEFSKSIDFTKSSNSASTYLVSSNSTNPAPSNLASANSNEFSLSHAFTGSKPFTRSVDFSKTAEFSQSANFTYSNKFTNSQTFAKSDAFSKISSFAHSASTYSTSSYSVSAYSESSNLASSNSNDIDFSLVGSTESNKFAISSDFSKFSFSNSEKSTESDKFSFNLIITSDVFSSADYLSSFYSFQRSSELDVSPNMQTKKGNLSKVSIIGIVVVCAFAILISIIVIIVILMDKKTQTDKIKSKETSSKGNSNNVIDQTQENKQTSCIEEGDEQDLDFWL